MYDEKKDQKITKNDADRSGKKLNKKPVNDKEGSSLLNNYFRAMQCDGGNQAVQRLVKSGTIQAKLTVSSPGDAHEREADRMAAAVMRKEVPGQAPEISPAVERSVKGIQRSGESLSKDTRSFFESRFNHDFSPVRIHNNAQAHRAARDINARAFTIGTDIAFGKGEYQPGTREGKSLLAHELTHVVQQGGGVSRKEVPVENLENQLYAHGGFMGMAVSFMNDAQWSWVFQKVDPDKYTQARKHMDDNNPVKVMEVLENAPVLTAYGIDRAGALETEEKTSLEWDVWLDKKDPGSLAKARIEHGTKGELTRGKIFNAVGLASMPKDISKRGYSPGDWIEKFGTALSLIRMLRKNIAAGMGDVAKSSALASLIDESRASGAIHFKALEAMSGGVYIDVKSEYSSVDDINAFIDELTRIGVYVRGLGVFNIKQIRNYDKSKKEETLSRVPGILFLHSFDKLLNIIEKRKYRYGDNIMFNGGALVKKEGDTYTLDAEKIKYFAGKWEEECARMDNDTSFLNIGIYVQETAVSPEVITMLNELVNKQWILFSLGFAYGNQRSVAEDMVKGKGQGGQDILINVDSVVIGSFTDDTIRKDVKNGKHMTESNATVSAWIGILIRGYHSAADAQAILDILYDKADASKIDFVCSVLDTYGKDILLDIYFNDALMGLLRKHGLLGRYEYLFISP